MKKEVPNEIPLFLKTLAFNVFKSKEKRKVKKFLNSKVKHCSRFFEDFVESFDLVKKK